MSEKKQVSRPAAKPATTARRVADKAVPTAQEISRQEFADEVAKFLALVQEAQKAVEERGPRATGPAALLKHVGTISHEQAEVMYEAVRWLRSEDDEAE
jgi:hypothetical protein